MAPSRRLRFLDIPAVQREPWGWVCLLLNLLPGGVGTIVAGVKAKHTASIVIGIVQLLLVVAIIGWLWSVVWGISIYMRSR